MGAYDPGITYQGDKYIYSGLTNLGAGFEKGFEQYQKAKEEHAGDQFVIDYALRTNMLTPEQHTQYLNGSRSQKNDIVAGLTRTFALDMKRKEEQRLAQNADLQRRRGEMELQSYPEEARARLNYLKSQAAENYADAGGAPGGGKPTTVQLTDEEGKKLPGLYYTYRPGSKAGQVVQTAPEGFELDIKTDPKTGTQYYLNRKGETVLLTREQVAAARMYKMLAEQAKAEGKATPTPTPGGSPGTMMPPAQGVDKAAALKWLRENPDDPRAAAIRARLGL